MAHSITPQPMFDHPDDPAVIEELAMRICAAAISSAKLQSFDAALAELNREGWSSEKARLFFVGLAMKIAERLDFAVAGSGRPVH